MKTKRVTKLVSSWSFLVGETGLEPGTSCMSSKRSNQLSYSPVNLVEARPGIEPGMRVLQTPALPLGYLAIIMERKTGFEPAALALARRCSTTEPLPLDWCRRPELNWRHADFQSAALPTELPRQTVRDLLRSPGYRMAEAMGFEPTVSCVTGTYVRPATLRLRVSYGGRNRA